jgi:hypothetical protein
VPRGEKDVIMQIRGIRSDKEEGNEEQQREDERGIRVKEREDNEGREGGLWRKRMRIRVKRGRIRVGKKD